MPLCFLQYKGVRSCLSGKIARSVENAKTSAAAMNSVLSSFHIYKEVGMAISVQCACGKRTSVVDALAGKTIRCPACGNSVFVALCHLRQLHHREHRRRRLASSGRATRARLGETTTPARAKWMPPCRTAGIPSQAWLTSADPKAPSTLSAASSTESASSRSTGRSQKLIPARSEPPKTRECVELVKRRSRGLRELSKVIQIHTTSPGW